MSDTATTPDIFAGAKHHLALIEEDIAMREKHIVFALEDAKLLYQSSIDALKKRAEDLRKTIGTSQPEESETQL